MPDQIVEVVTRFAGDLVDVVHVDPRGIELVAVRTDGYVTITMALVERCRPAVPRRRVEWRPLGFCVGSLVVHLAVWLAALHYGVVEPDLPSVATESRARRARLAPYASPAQTVRRVAKPAPAEVPITVDTPPSPKPAVPRPALAPPAPRGGTPRAAAAAANQAARHFDPTTSPDFDTVKTGAFATLATGRTTGDRYGADARRTRLVVVACDAASCLVVGGDDAAPIRKAVEQRLADITACYAQVESAAGHKVEVDFGIDAAGKLEGLQVGGVGDVGTCVANIVNAMRFAE